MSAVAATTRPRPSPSSDLTETKASKFRRLANKRVPKAIRMIRYIENLANTATYQYTPEQVSKVVDSLETAVKAVRNAFDHSKGSDTTFSV